MNVLHMCYVLYVLLMYYVLYMPQPPVSKLAPPCSVAQSFPKNISISKEYLSSIYIIEGRALFLSKIFVEFCLKLIYPTKAGENFQDVQIHGKCIFESKIKFIFLFIPP